MQPVASAAASDVVVADAAGQLDLDVQRADDLGEQLAVVAGAERGVEVDEVEPLGAGLLPGERGGERVAVGGLGAGLALDEAHGLAVADVDGGEQFELVMGGPLAGDTTRGSHRADGRRRRTHRVRASWQQRAPASPDFSGWNWVAAQRTVLDRGDERLAVRRPR